MENSQRERRRRDREMVRSEKRDAGEPVGLKNEGHPGFRCENECLNGVLWKSGHRPEEMANVDIAILLEVCLGEGRGWGENGKTRGKKRGRGRGFVFLPALFPHFSRIV